MAGEPRDIIAAALAGHVTQIGMTVTDLSGYEPLADAVLAALTDAGIVLCRSDPRHYSFNRLVPVEEAP